MSRHLLLNLDETPQQRGRMHADVKVEATLWTVRMSCVSVIVDPKQRLTGKKYVFYIAPKYVGCLNYRETLYQKEH